MGISMQCPKQPIMAKIGKDWQPASVIADFELGLTAAIQTELLLSSMLQQSDRSGFRKVSPTQRTVAKHSKAVCLIGM